jgi:hypothetical protein
MTLLNMARVENTVFIVKVALIYGVIVSLGRVQAHATCGSEVFLLVQIFAV